MKKTFATLILLTPLLAFAQSGTSTSTKPVLKDQTIASTTVACVQTALEKRENALIAAHDSQNTAVKTALTKRMTTLKDAWAQPDRASRVAKRQEAYKVFRTEVQTANTAMKTARNTAWKTYETEAKACGIKGGTGEAPSFISLPNSSL